jgi:hypothetical protein
MALTYTKYLTPSKSVIDLNAEIADRAQDLLLPQQKLHCPQIACTAVDECRLGSAQ